MARRIDAYKGQFEGPWQDAPASERVLVRFVLVEEEGPKNLPEGLAVSLERIEQQGYVLDVSGDGILCAAKDGPGLANGLASVLQLVHVKDGKLVARTARVVDWPTFRIRYTSEYQFLGADSFDWMMLYKVNGFATSYRVLDWDVISEAHRTALKAVGDYVEQYGTLHYMAQLHLSGRSPNGHIMDSCNPEHVETLFETVRTILELSKASHLWVCYDDSMPEVQPMEAEAGFKNPAAAHCALLTKLRAFVDTVRPETILGFVPVPYQGRHHRRWRPDYQHRDYNVQYAADIHAWDDTDVRIVWTGPVTESRRIVQEDIDHYKQLMGVDKPLAYWDNTWHYHQPLRNFHARYLDGFVDHCADRTSYINVNCRSAVGKFFTVTANDYYWNPDAFEEKRCRRHAVAQFMGPEAVEAAERFYELRGEDYWVFFAGKVDLDAFGQVLTDLEEASWTKEIPEASWPRYNLVAKARGEKEHTKDGE
jgi:hypothetical protein